jgi:hypothetical protein
MHFRQHERRGFARLAKTVRDDDFALRDSPALDGIGLDLLHENLNNPALEFRWNIAVKPFAKRGQQFPRGSKLRRSVAGRQRARCRFNFSVQAEGFRVDLVELLVERRVINSASTEESEHPVALGILLVKTRL